MLCGSAVKVSAASISKKKMTLVTGQTGTLKVKGAKKVTWKSSAKTVAKVSKKGRVTAVSAGKAVITAKAGKKKFKCRVTVVNADTAGTRKTVAVKSKLSTSTDGMSEEEARVFRCLLSMRAEYPEGRSWTNADYYRWNGGIYRGGYGCAAFAFILSDSVFGNAKARSHKNMNEIRPGDILRVDGNTHSVIVLRTDGSGVTVAEGNYNSSIHWGRVLTWNQLSASLNYVMTRYE